MRVRVRRRAADNGFALGEGLAGQAAVERKVLVLSDIPENYIQSDLALATSPLALLPWSHPENMTASWTCVEVASFSNPRIRQRAFDRRGFGMVALKLDVLTATSALGVGGADREHAEALATQAGIDGSEGQREEATKMKSMFLANMSHEIRTADATQSLGSSHLAPSKQIQFQATTITRQGSQTPHFMLARHNDIRFFENRTAHLILETTDFKLDEVIAPVTTLKAQKSARKGSNSGAMLQPAPGALARRYTSPRSDSPGTFQHAVNSPSAANPSRNRTS